MTLRFTHPDLQVRPIGPNDMAFLLDTYASTRAEEMERVPQWTDLMKREFIKGQFNAQHDYYQKNYVGGNFWVIENKGNHIGRLYLHENYQDKGMRIIDITISPVHRNRGIGESILKDLMQRAAQLGRPLSIHVETFNPAKNLYTRLGFKTVSETNGVYHLMEWTHTT
ncbi:GNAT family N-acetyltransferase [Dyadobacter sp. CY347]|uniref:GNAT family N-acetyltransferase n=1 Tax=Dyadobacter sp. CY347 TaxID=2909336 RepID=UPI001F45500E|nr:GNAT family N-acetyltransferase [Dyadobacter sp. CY347]MCF2488579.1 GNAT family N-acetyltransferase [Dyadobacter sp. CY347]